MRREIGVQNFSKRFLGRAGRRAVVVGEIEVGDAEIERAKDERAAVGKVVYASEIVPEAERERRKLQAAATAGAIEGGVVVAGGSGLMRHEARRFSKGTGA